VGRPREAAKLRRRKAGDVKYLLVRLQDPQNSTGPLECRSWATTTLTHKCEGLAHFPNSTLQYGTALYITVLYSTAAYLDVDGAHVGDKGALGQVLEVRVLGEQPRQCRRNGGHLCRVGLQGGAGEGCAGSRERGRKSRLAGPGSRSKAFQGVRGGELQPWLCMLGHTPGGCLWKGGSGASRAPEMGSPVPPMPTLEALGLPGTPLAPVADLGEVEGDLGGLKDPRDWESSPSHAYSGSPMFAWYTPGTSG